MAEAIGLVASVLQLAGTGLKLSQALYQYADSVATADRRIKDVAKEIKLTSFVIEELGGIFKQDDTLSLISKSAIATANETLDECSTMFGEIETTLNKSKKSKMGRLMLPFREPKIELLRSHIDKLKSTLQLLMQVLMHAFQVSSRKLDREAEARQRDEIRQLLENKKNTTKRYEESLQRFRTSDSNTETEDDGASFDDSGSVLTLVAKSIGSTMTPDSLAECAQHVRTLLESIEQLQRALASASEGDDQSDEHQMVVGSYFAARSHLDTVLLGSSSTRSQNVMLKTENHINKDALFRTSKPKRIAPGKEKKESIVVIETGAEEMAEERVKQVKIPMRLQETKRPNEEIVYVQRPKNVRQPISDTVFGSSKRHAGGNEQLRYGTGPFSCLPDHQTQTQTSSFGSAWGYSHHYSMSPNPLGREEICVPVPRPSARASTASASTASASAHFSQAHSPASLPHASPVPSQAQATVYHPTPIQLQSMFEQKDLKARPAPLAKGDCISDETASSPSKPASQGDKEVDDLLKEWTTCFA